MAGTRHCKATFVCSCVRMPSYEYAKGHGHVHARYLSYQTIVVQYYYY